MKLRQKLTIGLCAFYLMSIIGIALNMHFCGGKLSSVRFAETAKCGACKKAEKMEKDSDCCQNKSIDAKIKDSHEVGLKVQLPQNFSILLFLKPIFSSAFRDLLPVLFSKAENKPPPLSAIRALHAYYCVFRN